MDVAKVAKDYFVSSQSSLLIPNREFGSRKMFHLGITRSSSAGSIKLDHPPATGLTSPVSTTPVTLSGLTSKSNSLKGLFVSSLGLNGGRQKLQATSKGGKQWLHPSDALMKGHILYTVKFLGECKVDQPKGTEVVKSAITKMKFNKHIKRAEGQKPPKVELTISADAVKILDPKHKMILHQYPLHRISYCADDKSDKRMFTFIGKAADSNEHFCYVFDSEKCAEEITLTIGQAFELAYKRFIEASNPEIDLRKQLVNLQKKVNSLQFENDALKKRLLEMEKLKDKSEMEQYKQMNQLTDVTTVKLQLRESSTDEEDSPVSKEPNGQVSVVGRRLENLIMTDNNQIQSNGNHNRSPPYTPAGQKGTALLSPPPPNTRTVRQSNSVNDQKNSLNSAINKETGFGGSDNRTDAFGMEAFNPTPTTEQELMDIRDGFSRGLSFGTDDFNLDDLDPLNQRL